MRSESRAWSVPVLDDSRSAKSTETTANDRLLHFMAQPPKVEKLGEFGMTAQFVIEVQPLFIRNSFQQFFACVPSFRPKSRFVPTEVDLEQYPHLKTSSCAAPVQDFYRRAEEPGRTRYRHALMLVGRPWPDNACHR
jgi:hypothetical protein